MKSQKLFHARYLVISIRWRNNSPLASWLIPTLTLAFDAYIIFDKNINFCFRTIRMAKIMLMCLLIWLYFIYQVQASDDEENLMYTLFRGYNSLIQPIKNATDLPVIVKITLQLVFLINVDERDQVMHTNVWLTLRWYDYQMKWSPVNYGDIRQIRVSPDKVWQVL